MPWKEKQTNGYGYGMDYSKYFCSLATFSILFFLLYIEEFKKGIYFCLSASVSLRFRGKQNKKKTKPEHENTDVPVYLEYDVLVGSGFSFWLCSAYF